MAYLVNTKRRDVIILKIFQFSVAYFGRPCQILSDNGGEFDNEEMRELGDKFCIEIRTTAAKSHHSVMELWSDTIK